MGGEIKGSRGLPMGFDNRAMEKMWSAFRVSPSARSARGRKKKKINKRKKHLFCLFLFFNGTQQLAVATFHFLPYTSTLNMINNGTR